MKVFHILIALIILSSSVNAMIAAQDMFVITPSMQCCGELLDDELTINRENFMTRECCNYMNDTEACNTCYDAAVTAQNTRNDRYTVQRTQSKVTETVLITSIIIVPLLLIFFMINFIVTKKKGTGLVSKKFQKILWIVFILAIVLGLLTFAMMLFTPSYF